MSVWLPPLPHILQPLQRVPSFEPEYPRRQLSNSNTQLRYQCEIPNWLHFSNRHVHVCCIVLYVSYHTLDIKWVKFTTDAK